MKIIIASLILLLSSTANAMPVIDYQDNLKSSPEYVKGYVAGLGNGFEWNQGHLISKSLIGAKTYCVPSINKLNSDNLVQILNEYIHDLTEEKGKSAVDYYSIELILIWALEKKYPCQ